MTFSNYLIRGSCLLGIVMAFCLGMPFIIALPFAVIFGLFLLMDIAPVRQRAHPLVKLVGKFLGIQGD